MYVRDPSALWRRVGADVVVLSSDANDPLTLVGLSAGLWRILSVPTDLRAIRDALEHEGLLVTGRGSRELERILTLLVLLNAVRNEAVPA